ncbi:MAG: serine/threonine-protein phosphatase [Bacteroidaceae bacterium]|nr:serine/threonine-protein phosphatase [Bacteroidaceae bacterium]
MRYELYLPLAIHELGQRQNQEDTIFPVKGQATSDNRLFIVCDGMGGHEKGEVASNLVCQSISQYFQSRHVTPDQGLSDDTLREALQYAYTQLDQADDGAAKKMGTTLIFLYLHRNGATIAHIGDSRIYHIRPGRGVLYQSRDHSLVFELFQAGEITYDEMRRSPQKNIITRAMQPGEDNRVRADIVHTTDIQPGDYFYLCTDGMLEEMENEELAFIFSADISDEEKCQRLILATADNKDNHSAYLIHIKDVVREEGDDEKPNDEATSRYNAIHLIHQRNEEENQTVTPSNAENETLPNDDAPDVEIVGDDVSVVEEPTSNPVTPPRRFSFSKILRILETMLVLVALAFVARYAYHSFFSGEKEDEKADTITIICPDTIDNPMPLQQKDTVEKVEENTSPNEDKSLQAPQETSENSENPKVRNNSKDTTNHKEQAQNGRGFTRRDISKGLKNYGKQ